MNSNHDHEPVNIPDDVRAVAASLDALGEAERASAPERLEHNVLQASLRHLEGSAPLRIVTRPVFGPRLRIAAAVALAGGIIAIWALSGTPPARGPTSLASTNGLEDDVNFLLDLRSSTDELAILGERIDSLFLDTTNVRDALTAEPTSQFLGDGAL